MKYRQSFLYLPYHKKKGNFDISNVNLQSRYIGLVKYTQLQIDPCDE